MDKLKLPNHLPTNLSLASTGASSFLQETKTMESNATDKKKTFFHVVFDFWFMM